MVSQENPSSRQGLSLEEMLTLASRQSISRAIRIHMALELPMVECREGRIEWVEPTDVKLKNILQEYSAN